MGKHGTAGHGQRCAWAPRTFPALVASLSNLRISVLKTELEALGIPLYPAVGWFGLCISFSSTKERENVERFGFFFFFFFHNFKYSAEYKLILHF